MESDAVSVEFGEVIYSGGTRLGECALVLPNHDFYILEVGSAIYVFNKNHNFFIVQSGVTYGDGFISTSGQLLHVFYDVMVGGVWLWLEEGCLGIDLLLIFDFSPGGAEGIDEVTDGAIGLAYEVLLHFIKILGANACNNNLIAHIEAGYFDPPLYPESVLV